MDFETISVIAIMLSPVYAILLWQAKRISKLEKCITGLNTALKLKFKDLKDILPNLPTIINFA